VIVPLSPTLEAQIASDLHLPHWRSNGHILNLPILPKANILILAGDLCNGPPGIEERAWLQAISDLADWPDGIFMVPGNHDAYGVDLGHVAAAWRHALRGTRIRVLDRDVVRVRGVRLAGCTFWTDFGPRSMAVCFRLWHLVRGLDVDGPVFDGTPAPAKKRLWRALLGMD
jgi:hypothetical protein